MKKRYLNFSMSSGVSIWCFNLLLPFFLLLLFFFLIFFSSFLKRNALLPTHTGMSRFCVYGWMVKATVNAGAPFDDCDACFILFLQRRAVFVKAFITGETKRLCVQCLEEGAKSSILLVDLQSISTSSNRNWLRQESVESRIW